MNTSKRFVCGSLTLSCLAFSAAAQADPQPRPAEPEPTVWRGTRAQGRHVHSHGFSGSWALTDFLMRFRPGDKRIRHLGVQLTHKRARFAFADSGGTARYDYRASGYRIYQADSKSVSKSNCRGECVLNIGGPRAGYQFVLTGFDFSRNDGGAYVRRLYVRPNLPRGQIRVRFEDRGKPAYRVKIGYAWVRDREVRYANQEAHLRYRPGKARPRHILGSGMPVLRGFDLQFENGDHALNYIGILYKRPYLHVRFQDKNTDDPWRASIYYALLKNVGAPQPIRLPPGYRPKFPRKK